MSKVIPGSEKKPSGKAVAKDGSASPRPIRFAAKAMLGGAAATIAFGLWGIIAALTNKTAVLKYYESMGHETASQANSGFNAGIVFTMLFCLIIAAVWWGMSRAARAGQGWSRWVSSALFLAWTYVTYQSISTANTVVGLVNFIITLIIWGIGGAAIYQMWLPESSAYFKTTQSR
jgi:hypothetical protein